MARLYNGFDALGIGNAIANTQNNIMQQRASTIQSFGNTLLDQLAQQRQERMQREKEEALRKSAIDYLTSAGGIESAQAQSLVNSGVNPGDITRYVLGRNDQRAENDRNYNRGRADALFDREDERVYNEQQRDALWAHEKETTGRNWAGQMLSGAFAAQNSKMMNDIPSQAELDEFNNVAKGLGKYAQEQYGIDLGNLMLGTYGTDNPNGMKTREWYLDNLENELVGPDGKIDPKTLKAFQDEHKADGSWDRMMEIPGFKTKFDHLLKTKLKGSKAKRNAQDPDSGNFNTQEDYQRIYENAQEMARIEALHKNLVRLMISGGTLPNVSERDLAILEQMEKDGKIKKGIVSGYRSRSKK